MTTSGGRRVTGAAGSALGICLGLTLVAGCGAGSKVTDDPAAAASPSSATPRSDSPSEAPVGQSPSEAPVGQSPSEAPVGQSPSDGPVDMPTKGPHGLQGDVLSNLPGQKSTGCVPVGGGRDVRSGPMGAGPFDTARARFSAKTKAGRLVRLYFIPTHAAQLNGVAVTGVNGATGSTFRTRQTNVSDADVWKFYDLNISVPDAGTWTIRATAGPDRGCWVVDLA